eukprot:5601524-Pleurochrysis_carterae.AAC.2
MAKRFLHLPGTFRSNSWVATSDRRLVFISQLTQIDSTALGGKRIHSGKVFAKTYSFSFQQLRAEMKANSIVVPVVLMLQLLQLAHDRRVAGGCVVDAFPVPFLTVHCPDACWRWSAESFTSLVSNERFTCSPVHFARSKSDWLNPAVAEHACEDKLCFVFR